MKETFYEAKTGYICPGTEEITKYQLDILENSYLKALQRHLEGVMALGPRCPHRWDSRHPQGSSKMPP